MSISTGRDDVWRWKRVWSILCIADLPRSGYLLLAATRDSSVSLFGNFFHLCFICKQSHGTMRIIILFFLVGVLSTSLDISENSNVVIFRAASRDFFEKPYFGPYLYNVQCYAKRHSYSIQNCFEMENMSTSHIISPHYWRVRKAMELLDDTRFRSDTLFVYMDIDVTIRYNDSITIPQLVNQVTNLARKECDIIFQDYGRNFNSGFFVLRKTPLVRSFLHEWWDSCEKIGFKNVWLKDQGPANNAAIRLLAKHRGVNYTDECLVAALSSGPIAAMACYNHWMTDRLLLPPLERFAGGFCLPSNCSTAGGKFTTRFGVPVCESDYEFDSFLLHSKCAKAKAMIVQMHAKC